MQEHVMVHKANTIAQFFASYPHEEAVAGVAEHLKSFWEPRMLRQLYEFLEGGGDGLHELVPEAAARLRAPASGFRRLERSGCLPKPVILNGVKDLNRPLDPSLRSG